MAAPDTVHQHLVGRLDEPLRQRQAFHEPRRLVKRSAVIEDLAGIGLLGALIEEMALRFELEHFAQRDRSAFDLARKYRFAGG